MQILAFPCNSWNQETGTEAEIKSFAKERYGAHFPMFAKVSAIGPDAHPIFKFLIENLPEYKLTGWKPQWNFSKWLVNPEGMPVKSYDSAMDMQKLDLDIYRQLADYQQKQKQTQQ